MKRSGIWDLVNNSLSGHFREQAQRMGKVVRIHHNGVSYWQVKVKKRRLSGGDSAASVGLRTLSPTPQTVMSNCAKKNCAGGRAGEGVTCLKKGNSMKRSCLVLAVLLLVSATHAEECTIKDPTGQNTTGLLAIAPGVDEALGKAIDNNEAWRLAPYVQCILNDGNKVWVETRLKALATINVLKSGGCKSGTRGIVLTPVLNCRGVSSPKTTKKK